MMSFPLTSYCGSKLIYNKYMLKTYQFKNHCKGDSHSCKYHFARTHDKTKVNGLASASEMVFKFIELHYVGWNNSSHPSWIAYYFAVKNFEKSKNRQNVSFCYAPRPARCSFEGYIVRTSIALSFIGRFRRGFQRFFQKVGLLLFQARYIVLIFLLAGATSFAKLRSQISKSPKIVGNVCAQDV